MRSIVKDLSSGFFALPPGLRPEWVGNSGAQNDASTVFSSLLEFHLDWFVGTFQISLAYSAIVRSLENFPDFAILRIAFSVH